MKCGLLCAVRYAANQAPAWGALYGVAHNVVVATIHLDVAAASGVTLHGAQQNIHAFQLLGVVRHVPLHKFALVGAAYYGAILVHGPHKAVALLATKVQSHRIVGCYHVR